MARSTWRCDADARPVSGVALPAPRKKSWRADQTHLQLVKRLPAPVDILELVVVVVRAFLILFCLLALALFLFRHCVLQRFAGALGNLLSPPVRHSSTLRLRVQHHALNQRPRVAAR
jgi:hypothetical protein